MEKLHNFWEKKREKSGEGGVNEVKGMRRETEAWNVLSV